MRHCAALLTDISPRCSITAAVILLTTCSLSAQSAPALDQLLDRMGAYLVEYEALLGSVVADERFEQSINATRLGGERLLLESEVAFIRLPGDSEWLGFRDVRKVNSKPVADRGASISDLLDRKSVV